MSDAPGSEAAAAQEIADAIPHIVWTHDREGRSIYYNRKWTEYTGLDFAETVRVGPETCIHPEDAGAVLKKFAEARDTGLPFEARYRLRNREGAYKWHEARVVPLRTQEGQVSVWVGTAKDIDDQRRWADQQAFLVHATNVLSGSLEFEKTLSTVARLVVPDVADWCAVDLLDEAGLLQRATVAHVDPNKVQLAWDLWRRMPPVPDAPHGAYAVVRTGRAERIEELTDEILEQLIPDREVLAIIRSLGLRSSIAVPMTARDRVIGVLTLVGAESGRRYAVEDVAFAEEVARRMALAVDNARLYREAVEARAAAEALAAEVIEQSRQVEAALVQMRAERDAAVARAAEPERSRTRSGTE